MSTITCFLFAWGAVYRSQQHTRRTTARANRRQPIAGRRRRCKQVAFRVVGFRVFVCFCMPSCDCCISLQSRWYTCWPVLLSLQARFLLSHLTNAYFSQDPRHFSLNRTLPTTTHTDTPTQRVRAVCALPAGGRGRTDRTAGLHVAPLLSVAGALSRTHFHHSARGRFFRVTMIQLARTGMANLGSKSPIHFHSRQQAQYSD
jgi:hypothetical protein